jgi:branched-chain amino acid aminotransferase
MVDKVEKIWFDGALINWDDAKVHVLTHTLHYGLGVFEGIRCYKLGNGKSAIFRLQEHVDRLFESAHICTMKLEQSREDVVNACIETVRANRLEECYLRPLAFLGSGAMGLGATENRTHLTIVAWKWGAYLGDEGIKRGIRAKVSSFTRPGINSVMAKGKVVGHYVNSILAKREVLAAGYQEAIMLDGQGYVSEASGENIFVVKKGIVYTPPVGSAILGGITRDTVMSLCEELGLKLVERTIARDELYVADEVFMCGTAAEITPVREIDDRQIGIGQRGPVTERVQKRYFEVVRGEGKPHPEWLALV